MDHSGAGGFRVHLVGDLQHKDDVWPLVRFRVDAHTDQLPQLPKKNGFGYSQQLYSFP